METYKSRASSLGIVLSLLAAACETTSGAPPPDVPQDVRVIVDTPPSDVFDASAPNDLGPLLDAPMPGDGADATTDLSLIHI